MSADPIVEEGAAALVPKTRKEFAGQRKSEIALVSLDAPKVRSAAIDVLRREVDLREGPETEMLKLSAIETPTVRKEAAGGDAGDAPRRLVAMMFAQTEPKSR